MSKGEAARYEHDYGQAKRRRQVGSVGSAARAKAVGVYT